MGLGPHNLLVFISAKTNNLGKLLAEAQTILLYTYIN